MNKPKYIQPAIGWTTEGNKTGAIKYGVADYEPRKGLPKIEAPARAPRSPHPPRPLCLLALEGDGVAPAPALLM